MLTGAHLTVEEKAKGDLIRGEGEGPGYLLGAHQQLNQRLIMASSTVVLRIHWQCQEVTCGYPPHMRGLPLPSPVNDEISGGEVVPPSGSRIPCAQDRASRSSCKENWCKKLLPSARLEKERLKAGVGGVLTRMMGIQTTRAREGSVIETESRSGLTFE